MEKLAERLRAGRGLLMRILMGLVLVTSLTGCGLWSPKPPAAAVETALLNQIDQTQTLLSANLRGQPAAENPYQLGRVKVQHQRSLSLDDGPAVEVRGIYTLKGKGLSRSQQRQQRPFTLYLRRQPSDQQWVRVPASPG